MNSSAVEEGGKVASSLIETMKGQPITLAMVVFNIIFVFVVYFGLKSQRESHDKLISRFLEINAETARMLYQCAPTRPPAEPHP